MLVRMRIVIKSNLISASVLLIEFVYVFIDSKRRHAVANLT